MERSRSTSPHLNSTRSWAYLRDIEDVLIERRTVLKNGLMWDIEIVLIDERTVFETVLI